MNASKQVIINASAHEIPLPAGMVHTVCTSPPYYSLRRYSGEQEVDWPSMEYYQMPGQMLPLIVDPMRCALGLEPTPEAYIGHLVLCFREVKRVLREDGVCWIVIGDSYASQGAKQTGRNDGGQTEWTGAAKSGYGGESRYTGGSTPSLQQGDLMLIPHRLALALQGDGWLVRNDAVWHKKAPMPASVSGWRWERCRVKVKAQPHSGRDTDGASWGIRVSGCADNNSRVDRAASATWHPCPGCDKCSSTGGYVLRRGSWRHTRAHETVLMLAKGMGYYADQERVREALSQRSWRDLGKGDVTPAKEPKHFGDDGDMHGRFGAEVSRATLSKYDGVAGNPAGRNPRSVLTHGAPLVQLRADLTDKEREYVISELVQHGLL